MTPAEELDSERNLFLERCGEQEDGSLVLWVAAGRVASPPEHLQVGNATIADVTPIKVSADTPQWTVSFRSYIGYAVRAESFAMPASSERFSGRSLRVYQASPFLDFIRASTNATPEYPGAFSHYGIHCVDHVVDVVATEEPEVRRRAA